MTTFLHLFLKCRKNSFRVHLITRIKKVSSIWIFMRKYYRNELKYLEQSGTGLISQHHRLHYSNVTSLCSLLQEMWLQRYKSNKTTQSASLKKWNLINKESFTRLEYGARARGLIPSLLCWYYTFKRVCCFWLWAYWSVRTKSLGRGLTSVWVCVTWPWWVWGPTEEARKLLLSRPVVWLLLLLLCSARSPVQLTLTIIDNTDWRHPNISPLQVNTGHM